MLKKVLGFFFFLPTFQQQLKTDISCDVFQNMIKMMLQILNRKDPLFKLLKENQESVITFSHLADSVNMTKLLQNLISTLISFLSMQPSFPLLP